MKNISLGLTVAVLMGGVMVSCGKKQVPTVAPDIRVTTLVANPTDIRGSRPYSGTIEESNSASLSFPVAGTLKNIYVQPGDRVNRGQLIASLDDSSLRNAYEIAQSALNQAQDAYNRMKKLHDADALPDMKWVEVENVLKQAKSAELIARKAMQDAQIYSPIAGYVADKTAEPGMTIAPAIPIVKIMAIDPVKVSIAVPENEISGIAVGQKAEVTVGALGGSSYPGKLTEKGVEANPLTRTYDVKFEVTNTDHRLLPGMVCDLVIENEDTVTSKALVLPMSAVLLDANNRNFVWLAKDGRARKQMVEVEGLSDSGLIIRSGIADGDSVIVSGQQKISENTRVISIN